MQKETKPVILLAVLEYGELPELLRVAEVATVALQGTATFMFVKHSYRRLAEDTAAVVAGGFLWMDAQGDTHSVAAPSKVEAISPKVTESIIQVAPVLPSRAAGRGILGRLRVMALLPLLSIASVASAIGQATRQIARDVANCLRDMRRFRRRYQELHRLLEKLSPSLLVVGQDSLGGELSFLLIAAGRLNIPRLITPFAMFTIEETAEFAKSNPRHHVGNGVLNRLAAFAFPHWVLQYQGHRLLRLPGYRAIALEMTGLVHALPWTSLSEPVEAITAHSKVAADALVALGVERAKLHVTGSPMNDRLAMHLSERDQLRGRICAEFGMAAEKPLLVCGWPVNMFAWLSGRHISYPDYPAVAMAWANHLADVREKYGVNVIVSIHPKTLAAEIVEVERVGLPYRMTGTDELIAACDVFTTLNGSSVTAWAIACGVPTVLFDCFLTCYPDFLNVPGCVNVETEEEFKNALHLFCGDANARAALARRQSEVSQQWGLLDGQAGVRLSALMHKLVKDAQT